MLIQDEMKGMKSKNISTFIITLLTLLLISTQIALADDQVTLSFKFVKQNQPPTIHDNEYPTNTSVNVMLKVTCSIQVSDPDNDSLNIYWYENTTGNWVLRQTNSLVNSGTYYWTYEQATEYSKTYYWRVVINDGNYSISAIYYFTTKQEQYQPPTPPPPQISNQPPIAKITGPNNAYENETMIFYATDSYDPDGKIVGYRWDFQNDGIFDTDWLEEAFVLYRFTKPGEYTIILQVKDNETAIATTSHTITIMQLKPNTQLPIPVINDPYNNVIYYGYTNETITFNSTGTYDPDGEIVNYTWYFGDWNISYMKNPEHVYTKPGEYIVVLKVTDNDGLSNITGIKVIIRDREIKEPEERTLTFAFPLFLIIIINIVIAVILLLMLKRYKITVSKEKDKPDENKEENVESKIDILMAESGVDELISKLNKKEGNK